MQIIIDKQKSGQKLGIYLNKEVGISQKLITAMKHSDGIKMAGKSVFTNYIVKEGDVIDITFPVTDEGLNIAQYMPLDIVFEDEYILAVNKPSGVIVHPTFMHRDGTLAQGVKYYYEQNNIKSIARPLGRLDKNTAGICIFCKNSFVHTKLEQYFKANRLNKKYTAIVDGVIEDDNGIIAAPIERDLTSIMVRKVCEYGKEAITHFEVLNRYKKHTLIKLALATGRTHQIRVHMQHIGHPLVGDYMYGTEHTDFLGQALVCSEVTFVHPITKKQITLNVPLTKEMQDFLNS